MSNENPLSPIEVLRLNFDGISGEQFMRHSQVVSDWLLRDLKWSKIYSQEDPKLAASAWKRNGDRDLCLMIVKEFVDRQVQDALRKNKSALDRFKFMIGKFNDSHDKEDVLWDIYEFFSPFYNQHCEISVRKDDEKWENFKAAFNFAFNYIKDVAISLQNEFEAADSSSQT